LIASAAFTPSAAATTTNWASREASPATNTPGPFGLPLSVQLIGPHRGDDKLVAWARWVEQRLS